MKAGARTVFQNRCAPDCRAQDCNYLYLNNYTYYLYLKENSKIFWRENAPPLLLIRKSKIWVFLCGKIQKHIIGTE